MTEFEQQPLNPEQQLADEFMTISREAYLKMRGLLYRDTSRLGRTDIDRSPQADRLHEAIGSFVLDNLDQIDQIHDVPYTVKVHEALSEYIATAMAHKLDWVSYKEYGKKHEADIAKLLEGRTITAQSLVGSVWEDNGAMLTLESNSSTRVSGKFHRYDTGSGDLHIQNHIGSSVYRVSIWRKGYETDAELERQAEITIHPL